MEKKFVHVQVAFMAMLLCAGSELIPTILTVTWFAVAAYRTGIIHQINDCE